MENLSSNNLKRKYGQYSKENLDIALKKVKHGECTIYQSAKTHDVPFNTLKRKLQESGESSRGPQKILSVEEEAELVEFVLECAKVGYPVTANFLMTKAHEISNTHDESSRRFGIKGEKKFSHFKLAC